MNTMPFLYNNIYKKLISSADLDSPEEAAKKLHIFHILVRLLHV